MADWDKIVNEHGPIVIRAATRILGNSTEAQDVAQDVFLQVFKLWKKQSVGNWAGILRSIATRRAIDYIRKRRPTVPFASDPIATSPSPTATLESKEMACRLRIELAKLPKRQAEIFALRYFECLSNQEISVLLRTSSSSVSTALNKARTALSQALADFQNGDPR